MLIKQVFKEASRAGACKAGEDRTEHVGGLWNVQVDSYKRVTRILGSTVAHWNARL